MACLLGVCRLGEKKQREEKQKKEEKKAVVRFSVLRAQAFLVVNPVVVDERGGWGIFRPFNGSVPGEVNSCIILKRYFVFCAKRRVRKRFETQGPNPGLPLF